jgi:hypothetical protein
MADEYKASTLTPRAHKPVDMAIKSREKSVSGQHYKILFYFYFRIINENTLPEIGSIMG